MANSLSAADLAYADIRVGDTFAVERTFSRQDTLDFAALSGDASPLHVDEGYAAGTEFGGCVVHGLLLASLFSQLVGMQVPGVRALYLGQDLTFRRPVRVGERVRAIAKVTGKSDATHMLSLSTEIRGADDRVAVTGLAKVKVRGTETVRNAETEAIAAAPREARPSVALVSGATGGLGSEIARALARNGMAVAVNYHSNAERARSLVGEIRDAGGRAAAFAADVRDRDAVASMVKAIDEELGAPTVLVNAAIGELRQRAASELEWADFADALDYQLRSVFELCKAVHHGMKEAGGGAVVNLLSQVNAGAPPPQMADYVAAKHALEGLSKALAVEWAADGIRVNMVSPGLVRTELTDFHHERVFRMEAARTPLHRLATPTDVASAVAYLAGTDSSFLTGTNLFVTGGQVML